jgi:membrane associated rhomboid family serine protease
MRRYPYQGSTVNPVLVIIGVNVMVFMLAFINLSTAERLLGLRPDLVLKQPWTLVTSMFMHDHRSYSHILFNMLTLYFFGTFLVNLVGDRKFLLVYFGGGLLGGILFVLLASFTGDMSATVVGASGAVFSVGGTLAVLAPNARVLLFFFLPMPLWVAVIFGFGILSIPNLFPGIAWQAHLGGLVFGLIAGYIFRRQQFRRVRW